MEVLICSGAGGGKPPGPHVYAEQRGALMLRFILWHVAVDLFGKL